jgi:hypothetical protein
VRRAAAGLWLRCSTQRRRVFGRLRRPDYRHVMIGSGCSRRPPVATHSLMRSCETPGPRSSERIAWTPCVERPLYGTWEASFVSGLAVGPAHEGVGR